MIDLLKKILDILTKREIIGVIITIILSVFIYEIIVMFLTKVINKGKTEYEQKKRKTITKLFQNLAKYVIMIIAILIILSIYGVNVKGMIAGLGITATILGLALQDTFKDIINGINIILENYFVVGDIVSYNNFVGEVMEFGLKSTKIKNKNGEVLSVANRNIMEILNLSQKEHVITINIPLRYEENIENIENIIVNNIIPNIATIDNVNKSSIKYLGIDELKDSSVNYLIEFTCKRDTQWQAKRDAHKIILNELTKNKISIPYPQLEVHNDK